MASFNVGDTVTINADGRPATVRFAGPTNFQTGEWVGLELEDYTGKNDGSVKGEYYFECEMGRGMFVRPSAITLVQTESAPARKMSVGGPSTSAAGPRRMSRVGGPATAVPTSAVGAAGLRRAGSVSESTLAQKRMSANSGSPSPAPGQRSSMVGGLARPGSVSRVCTMHRAERGG